eukprot:CAMPEP_0176458972 /NCGR_PEP_ID=MMETSP0127-20121128/32947_1 /TAXON_ID=938130 /ORGANISM="Platyophrya macrostoma, Strain WH" /LENGTH=72 /DNA_ID=CAMNT_0017849715 /DNA_START=37 /DNA_END=251 /DNA_ORIENTATION=-
MYEGLRDTLGPASSLAGWSTSPSTPLLDVGRDRQIPIACLKPHQPPLPGPREQQRDNATLGSDLTTQQHGGG